MSIKYLCQECRGELGVDCGFPAENEACRKSCSLCGSNHPHRLYCLGEDEYKRALLAGSSMAAEITIRDKYGPAMDITDQGEADSYFRRLLLHDMSFGESVAEAERIEKINLGYYAGYYDSGVRIRVERLFHCSHLFFGRAEHALPTPEEAFRMGQEIVTNKQIPGERTTRMAVESTIRDAVAGSSADDDDVIPDTDDDEVML